MDILRLDVLPDAVLVAFITPLAVKELDILNPVLKPQMH